MFSNNLYLYGLISLPKVGPITLQKLLQLSESPKDLWEALDERRLKTVSADFQSFLQKEKKKVDLSQLQQLLKQTETKTVSILDEEYPTLLKEIPDAPVLLFYKGSLPSLQQPTITVVGTRTMSHYGLSVLEELITPLCQQGIGIISGLAFGVDAQAHKIALNKKQYTAAVLGSSVDYITPSRHDLLAQQIIDSGGGILSESPPKTKAYDGSFPRRNRILAGFSPVTLIVEAAEKSGALITAKYALDYNRDIATIPGNIFSATSKGCNNLLKQGAIPITNPEQLMELLQVQKQASTIATTIDLSDSEISLLQLLTPEPQPIDVFSPNFSGRSAELFQLLTSLELKQVIQHIPGHGYCLKKEKLTDSFE